MKAFLTKRRIGAVAVLLVAAAAFIITGTALESALQGTWVSPCKVGDTSYPFEIIQAGDTLYLSNERDFTIHVFKSSDGCNWSGVDPDFFKEGEYVWRHSACLFNAPGGNLGMAWVESESDRCTIFWSTFDGSTWGEPEFLLQRDEQCSIEDVIVLENGALLLLWNEFLVHQVKNGDRTFEASGCDVIYRAYINNDELLIERIIEPEDPWFCSSDGYSFVDDGHYIWCVFEHGLYEETPTVYRSRSEDGKMWSPPEPIHLPDSIRKKVFLTSKGEIGVLSFEVGKKDLFLFRSSDWKKWSREKLFKAEEGIKGAMITEGPDKTMWGFVHTKDIEDDLYFIHSKQESKIEYEKRIFISSILENLSLFCIALLMIFIVSWILKSRKE